MHLSMKTRGVNALTKQVTSWNADFNSLSLSVFTALNARSIFFYLGKI